MKVRLKNREFNPGISHPYYPIRRHLLQAIARHAPGMTGRMMDFGCGTKPYQPLFENVTEYTGVDFEGEGHSHENEQIDVFYDGKTIPFPDNHFDSILCTEVLEHVFNPREILQELHRVLKPGGRLLLTVPFAWHEHESPNDFGRYTSFGLNHIVEKAGFEVESQEKTSHFVETVFQLWGLYWYIHIFPKIPVGGGLLAPVFHFFNNATGRVMGKILPRKKDLFLNLVMMIRKP